MKWSTIALEAAVVIAPLQKHPALPDLSATSPAAAAMDLLLTIKLCLQLLFCCIQSLLWLLPSEGYCEAVGFSSMDTQWSGTLVFLFVSVLLDPNEVTNSADSWQFPKMLKWHYWEPPAQWDRASLGTCLRHCAWELSVWFYICRTCVLCLSEKPMSRNSESRARLPGFKAQSHHLPWH